MARHRMTRYAAGATVTSLLVLAPLVAAPLVAAPLVAATVHPAVPASPVIGEIAFVAKNQTVQTAQVHADGTESSVHKIGPVTPAKAGRTITINDLVTSNDGVFAAWDETVTSGKGVHEKFTNVLAVREVVRNKTLHETTDQFPVGFAGITLVTTDGTHTKQFSLQQGTLDPVTVPHTQYPLGTYGGGVVDETSSEAPPGPSHTDRLRLTSLAGKHRALHSYVLHKTQYDDPDAAWTSGDGKKVVIERGNHQDFGGLGPSSLVDEFSLGTTNTRHQLDHYGTSGAMWRVASVSFAGPSDTVWAVWERGTRTGAASAIASFTGGNWQRSISGGIAVAGNAAGYVVEQKGTYVEDGGEGGEAFTTVPTTVAQLVHGTTTVPMTIEGSAFVWVALPPA